MKILVLNAGSSSLKSQYFIDQVAIASVSIGRIGEAQSETTISYEEVTHHDTTPIANHAHALKQLLEHLHHTLPDFSITQLDGVGHRVVHGGSTFSHSVRIDGQVIETIKNLIPLAPLHNPANLEGITYLSHTYPNLPQVALFDTAFHQTLPPHTAHYPLPLNLYEESGVRRYGFHGISHAYVAHQSTIYLKKPLHQLNLITLHLGNGASATAIRAGRSVDTSMGFSPLEGLMMGTRSGDIDPAIIPFLSRTLAMSLEEIDTLLNTQSGLKGICGTNEMREILSQAEDNDRHALLALEMFTYRIQKYIGAYWAILGRVDAIIFTGGIGEHAPQVREQIIHGLEESIGLRLNPSNNQHNTPTIHHPQSTIPLLIIPTNEEQAIALETEVLLQHN